MKSTVIFATALVALSTMPIVYAQPQSVPVVPAETASKKPILDGAKPIEKIVPPGPAVKSPPAAATTVTKPMAAITPAASASSAASPAAAATPAPAVVVVTQPAAPAPEPPPTNNWGAGVLGLIILGVGGYFGIRYAQKRGVTVAESLQKLGVEMPQDGMNGPASVSHLKPPPPQAASLPPLPSLANLPEAAATAPGAATAVTSVTAKRTGVGSFVGTLGPVEGKQLSVPADGPLTMGRDADNTLPLPGDTTVSRRHARIEASSDGKGFQIVDEGSSNGTYVNGQRLTAAQARTLVVGDEIQIGASRLRFEG